MRYITNTKLFILLICALLCASLVSCSAKAIPGSGSDSVKSTTNSLKADENFSPTLESEVTTAPFVTDAPIEITDAPTTEEGATTEYQPYVPEIPDPNMQIPESPFAGKFIADLAEFEQYFEPNSDEFVFLVNNDNMLPSDFAPDDLVEVTDTRKDGRDAQLMRRTAEKALQGFFKEIRANGFTDVSVTSGYRNYNVQKYLLDQHTKSLRGKFGDKAEEEALKSIAYPGASEHQSGLCVDMHSFPTATTEFGDTTAGKWMAENAHLFGFIVRYPADKVEVTGISYEPWHFRYVGRKHATKMYEKNLCLEEYAKTLS